MLCNKIFLLLSWIQKKHFLLFRSSHILLCVSKYRISIKRKVFHSHHSLCFKSLNFISMYFFSVAMKNFSVLWVSIFHKVHFYSIIFFKMIKVKISISMVSTIPLDLYLCSCFCLKNLENRFSFLWLTLCYCIHLYFLSLNVFRGKVYNFMISLAPW